MKKIIGLVVWLLCVWPIWASADGDEKVVFQNFSPKLNAADNIVAAPLEIANLQTKDLWNIIYRSPEKIIRPGRAYTIRLKYTVKAKSHPEAGLVFMVRPADVQHGNSDLHISIGNAENAETVFETKVDVPEGMDRYIFQIHTKYGVTATVTDLEIIEREPRFATFKAVPEALPVSIDRTLLPTGSAEFEVEQPQAAADAPVLHGEQFGIGAQNPDNTAAMHQALAECRRVKAAALILKKETLRFSGSQALEIKNLQDFTLDGGGSTWIFQQISGNDTPGKIRQGGDAHILVENCNRILMKNWNIDWDWAAAPLASFVKVIGKGENKQKAAINVNWVEFEFTDFSVFPDRKLRIADIEAVDPQTMAVGLEQNHHSSLFEFIVNHPDWGNKGKIEWTAPNRVKVFQSRDSGDQNWFFEAAQPGMLYRMRHFSYDNTSILLNGGNRHLTFQDINLYSCPGMGVLLLNDQKYLEFNRFNTTIPAGSHRSISCTSDNFHSSMSLGCIKFIDCEFGWGGDDCINLTDSNGCAAMVAPNRLKIRNYGVNYISPGDRVELRDTNFAPLGLEFTVQAIDPAQSEIEIAGQLPLEKFGKERQFVLFHQKYDTSNVIIRNCKFGNNRGHGVVASIRKMSIENNRFDHTAFGAIMLSTGYSLGYWGEGMGVSDAVIRNNVFNKVNPVAADAQEKFAMDIAVFLYAIPEPRQKMFPLMSRILFENNTFINPTGAVLYVKAADDIYFIGNTIEVTNPRNSELPHRGSVILESVTDAVVLNNVWKDTPNNHGLIMVSTRNKDQLKTGGNRLVK